MKTNVIYHGDNLSIMKGFESNKIDLIYIDPPFFSQKNYGYFNDSWKDMKHYIEWMQPRIKECYRLLKDTGSIFLHCDYHSSHRLRCLLDDEFGENNFVNEIIWHYKKWTNSPKNFQKNHDNIWVYKKGKEHIFNKQYQPYADDKWVEDTVRIVKNGKLVRAKDKNGNFIKRDKKYKGVPMHDVFNDISWGATNKERIGYPTQKPKALLKRIIECSTKENDIVADFFCGSGTTLVAAEKLNRKWIGIDINKEAVEITQRRIRLRF